MRVPKGLGLGHWVYLECVSLSLSVQSPKVTS
ncbi:hypothetical protein CPT_Pila_001 [Serratia phage Pila]|uniref:Uncharacterized protein n=1 Tax=Serratia phage Pila TaxID=2650875 RepID=A0A5J6T7M5_9CAUD|nr:hypothetical protein CPT_Pila_001 [Serratia phage Pila]